jgi:hypothetical protein
MHIFLLTATPPYFTAAAAAAGSARCRSSSAANPACAKVFQTHVLTAITEHLCALNIGKAAQQPLLAKYVAHAQGVLHTVMPGQLFTLPESNQAGTTFAISLPARRARQWTASCRLALFSCHCVAQVLLATTAIAQLCNVQFWREVQHVVCFAGCTLDCFKAVALPGSSTRPIDCC